MQDASIPTRVWKVEVRRTQDGLVEIPENELDLPDGVSFEDIEGMVLKEAEAQAKRNGRGVDWVETVVETHGVTWV